MVIAGGEGGGGRGTTRRGDRHCRRGRGEGADVMAEGDRQLPKGKGAGVAAKSVQATGAPGVAHQEWTDA